MMVTPPLFTKFVEAQTSVLAGGYTHFAALKNAERDLSEYPGWMFWKKYPRGKSYLVHAYDRTGRGTTLGGETPENVARLEQFKAEQQAAKMRLKITKDRVEEYSAFIKAARLNRFPRRAAAIVRALEQDGKRQAVVHGDHALFAYEALLRVLFTPSFTSPDSLVIELSAANGELGVGHVGAKVERSLRELLLAADRSLSVSEDGASAVNDAGFRVMVMGRDTMWTGKRPATPTLAAQTLRQVIFDQDGRPLEIGVPDPRLFAAQHALLAEADEGNAELRTRDYYLSKAVTDALHEWPALLPPLRDLPDSPDAARLTAILVQLDLAGKQVINEAS